MVGANIDQVILSFSGSTLKQLTGQLVTVEQAANENDREVKVDDIDFANNGSVAILSEQSDDQAFLLSVVKVKSRQHGSTTAEDVSDFPVIDTESRTKDKSFGQSTASLLVGNCVDKTNEIESSSGSNFISRSTSNASTIGSVKFILNKSCDDFYSSSDTNNFRK